MGPTPGGSRATTPPPSDDDLATSTDVICLSESDGEACLDEEDVVCLSDSDSECSGGQNPADVMLVLRHLPAQLNTQTLLDIMNTVGFNGDFDFCYAPVRF